MWVSVRPHVAFDKRSEIRHDPSTKKTEDEAQKQASGVEQRVVTMVAIVDTSWWVILPFPRNGKETEIWQKDWRPSFLCIPVLAWYASLDFLWFWKRVEGNWMTRVVQRDLSECLGILADKARMSALALVSVHYHIAKQSNTVYETGGSEIATHRSASRLLFCWS